MRVYRRPPESSARHCNSHDSGAGAMGTPSKGGLFGNSACRIGMGGCHCPVTNPDSIVDNHEDEYVTMATDRGNTGWRRSRIFSPPRDAAQGDQWKTAVNGNNYSSS